ncbi:hypothetical protein AK812_SmicGene9555 [Symbiodinium microadriaticum]|uniref:Uncharacterized protein n=1 Tax=Symbiodinium microadriaticum TaxID=2951 RepID=A0A1Q9EI34_SYMMI|nr:hypothetical protein AK812_SmicGene9555 [Symbiodinium microadriaticum]
MRHSVVDQALVRHRRLAEELDADARRRLETVDPSRAVEIIEEVAKRTDVRNPSAFVMRAISDHPQQRGDIHLDHPQQRGDVHDELELLLARYPQVSAGLDEAAVAKLREAELDRAEEILEDMAHMGIHNPSAFVVKAVSSSRIRRGNPDALAPPPAKMARTQYRNGLYPEARTGRMPEASSLERRGAQAGLDDDALRLLRAADPARAAEVLEELELKGREVRNPSAFVSKSLSQFPMPRRR